MSELMNRAGITVGLINDIPTCEELVSRMTDGAEAEIKRLGSLVGPAAPKRESKL